MDLTSAGMEGIMRTNLKLYWALTTLLALILFAKSAYAYLDPGTGSMLVQAVIAAVAAVSVSLGVFRRRIRLFLGRIFGWKNSGGHDSDDT